MNSNIGVIGLGVMGKNIAINMMNHGYLISGYNRSYGKTKALAEENHKNFTACETLEAFVNSLESPKKIFLMVPAGKPVDEIVEELLPLLNAGDILMDGGNSYFKDTNRREAYLAEHHIHYFGVGVSGGEEGALNGPSIMPSGAKEAYAEVGPILEAIAAKKDGEPCCVYIGPQGSGHYVKMVHNGIEYADMQLLAEVYLILKNEGYSNQEISKIMTEWNQTEVESYLVAITATVLAEKDDKSDQDLIDIIVDVAGNKGTGRWTSIEALSQEYNASLLSAAYQARIMSNQLSLRKALKDSARKVSAEASKLEAIHKAYALAKSVAFAQGFGLYKNASDLYGWDLDLKAIASIFRAGCIIQARLLQDITKRYVAGTENILILPEFKAQVLNNNSALRTVVGKAIADALPIPVMSAALTYLDQLSANLLGANLIQGQRDYFGAHTYQRIDTGVVEHHHWG